LALVLAIFTWVHLIALKKLSHSVVEKIKYSRLILEIIVCFGIYFWLRSQITGAKAN
jgi:hypothetical protein